MARVQLLACVILWGWSFVASKICLEYIDPFELMGVRLALALPILFLVVRLKRIDLKPILSGGASLWVGAAILTAHFLIQVTGIKYTTATNTGWIISVTPLVLALLAWLFLKERISKATVAGIVIATVGILLLVSDGKLGNLDWLSSVGDWLVLVSAHTWALYTVVTKRVIREHPALGVTFVVLVPATLICVGYMAAFSDWSYLTSLPLEVYLSLIFLGVFAMALGHWFWQEGVREFGAARTGVYLYLEPIATTVLAVPYLGERFSIFTAVGGVLVLIGVWRASERKRTRNLS